MLRPRVRGIALVIATFVHPMTAQAQTAAAATFEVASVKPNIRPDGPRGIVVDPGRFTATGVVLADLIRYAYGFNSLASQSQVIGGPSWVTSARFDIVATATGQPTLSMLKSLLQDRFKVVAHVENRETAVFALTADRADHRLGPAIHPSTSQCVGPGGTAPPSTAVASTLCGTRGRPGMYTAEGVSMAQLARLLGNFPAVGRAVVDRTELGGVYDWTLQWTPSVDSAGAEPEVKSQAADAGISLFTALREQLGLKLEPQRAPIDVLVIDHAERPAVD